MKALMITDKYFLSNENIYNIENKFKNITTQRKNKNMQKQKNIEKPESETDIFLSKFKFIQDKDDSLFWCWFIFEKGIDGYYIETNINKSKFSSIKTIKMSLIQNIRNNKSKIKKLKLKVNDVENNLIYEDKMNLKTLLSILTCKDQNIVYINEKIYYKNIVNTDNKTMYIYKSKDTYGISLNDDIDHVYLEKNRLLIENIDKPLKAISSYKAQELRDICTKMKIDIMKSPTKYKTKKDLYMNLQKILL